MTSKADRLSVAGILALVTVFAHADDATVFTTNYDIRLSIDKEQYRVHSRALVHSGSEIPNVLQDFKVGLRVSETSPASLSVQVIVYERNGSDWYQITVPPPTFSAELGMPVEYIWESGGMKVGVAMIVGVHKR